MTKGYWFKIILGALAIFVLGMVVVEGISEGKHKIEQVVASNASINLPLLSKPFMLEGRDLGAMKSLRIDRSAPKAISGIHLSIDLENATALEALATCDLSLDSFQDVDFASAGFVCVSPLDMVDQEMIPFGTITFQPSGQVHQLNIPRSIVDDLRHEMSDASVEVGEAMAEVRTAVSEIRSELDGNAIQVKVNGKNVIDMAGAGKDGHMIIRDPATGKTIVEIKGGPDGGVLKIDAGEATTATSAAADSR